MEMYNVPEQGHTNAYMIQRTESNPHFTTLLPEQFQTMYSEGAPEFVVDQGVYYPTHTNYGYVCTGYDSPVDWDDHHRVFGLDGQDIQYTGGVQTENLPYVYYTPSYGYTQSLYNPYNPYIPGAMIGVDSSFVGGQQYYTVPAYDSAVTSPAYFSVGVQSRSDITPNSSADTFIDNTAPTAKRADAPGLKHNMSSASPAFSLTPIGPASSHSNSFPKVSEGNKSSVGATKQPPLRHGGVSSGCFPKPPQAVQGRGVQPVENYTHPKPFSSRDHPKVNQSVGDGLSSYGSSAPARNMVDKFQPKFFYGKITDDVKASPDMLTEQNRGPRTNKSKNQLVVKAYTARAGEVDEQGNITVNTEQYNREDFLVDIPNAKFFVIKSYSEDDVHKSIKYNVWSSTPNGNKKLSSAYEDAQRIAAGNPKGCPIFLFFSVNASGQFCGVAEMTGPVDFHKDMDFWQQDKWTGSFPVKWHIIKDVPNPNFRHILLENNENKPVTNSRDTQEIRQRKGIEVLKIFKVYAPRTSLLDDFMYYENRQKILQEEKARLLIKNFGSSFVVPVLDPPRKLQSFLNLPSNENEKIVKLNDSDDSKMVVADKCVEREKPPHDDDNIRELNVDAIKIGSLTINPKPKQFQAERQKAAATTEVVPVANTASVVTVDSMPVKVNGFAESSDFITIGTIPIIARALQRD